MRTKYYLIKCTGLTIFGSDWELKPNNIIEDVGSNMFVATSIRGAIENRFQQLGPYASDIIRVIIKHNEDNRLIEELEINNQKGQDNG